MHIYAQNRDSFFLATFSVFSDSEALSSLNRGILSRTWYYNSTLNVQREKVNTSANSKIVDAVHFFTLSYAHIELENSTK